MSKSDADEALASLLEWSEPVVFDCLRECYGFRLEEPRARSLAHRHVRQWRALIAGDAARFEDLRRDLFAALAAFRARVGCAVEADACAARRTLRNRHGALWPQPAQRPGLSQRVERVSPPSSRRRRHKRRRLTSQFAAPTPAAPLAIERAWPGAVHARSRRRGEVVEHRAVDLRQVEAPRLVERRPGSSSTSSASPSTTPSARKAIAVASATKKRASYRARTTGRRDRAARRSRGGRAPAETPVAAKRVHAPAGRAARRAQSATTPTARPVSSNVSRIAASASARARLGKGGRVSGIYLASTSGSSGAATLMQQISGIEPPRRGRHILSGIEHMAGMAPYRARTTGRVVRAIRHKVSDVAASRGRARADPSRAFTCARAPGRANPCMRTRPFVANQRAFDPR